MGWLALAGQPIDPNGGGGMILEHALELAGRSVPVFACGADKRPLTKNGFKDATADEAAVRRMFAQSKAVAIGMPTGAASGITVLDVDGEDGAASLAALEAEHGALPETTLVRTQSGGRHFHFLGEGVRGSVRRLGPGLDVRGEGGYVIVPPSRGEQGEYVYERNGTPAAMPAWLAAAAVAQTRSSIEVDFAPSTIPDGQRNDTLASIGGRMRRDGHSEQAIFAALRVANDERCDPPLEDDEVAAIARSVSRYTPAAPDDVHDDELPVEVDLVAIHREPLPELRWLCERHPMIYEGPYARTVYARDGVGKSIAELALALDVVRDGNHVVWIDHENGRDVTVRRLVAIEPDADKRDDLVQRLHLYTFQHVVRGNIAELVERWQGYGTAKVWIDALASAAAIDGVEDENANIEIRRYLQELLHPIQAGGMGVTMIDHTGHANADHARGASGKGDEFQQRSKFRQIEPFGVNDVGLVEWEIQKDRNGQLSTGERFRYQIGGTPFVFEPVAIADDDDDVEQRRHAAWRSTAIAALKTEGPMSVDRLTKRVPGKTSDVKDTLKNLPHTNPTEIRLGSTSRYDELYHVENPGRHADRGRS